MRPRLCVALVAALLGSLSLTVPAAQAEPSFDVASFKKSYGLPGSVANCLDPYTVGTFQLPRAEGTGTVSYTLTPDSGTTLPTGLTIETTTTPPSITGGLDLRAATAATYSLTLTATDAADSQTATLPVTIEIVDERPFLEALYASTDGGNWTAAPKWPAPIDAATCLADLYGVTLGTDGRVEWLELSDGNLTGTIPAEIGSLTRLTRLQLDNNQLSGAIPNLSTLTRLTNLQLFSNQLSGAIPNLSTLTRLDHLDLHGNQLSGKIPDLSSLTRLTYLTLSGNQMTGKILDLSTLTRLTNLQLYNNRLTGAIPALSTLTSLETLRLEDNQLSGAIPDNLPTSLLYLYLYNNRLTGAIPALSTLTKLEELRLNDNRLTGEIPPEISTLTELRYLRLEDNQLSGEIPALSALTKLKRLRLHNNQLSGAIPDMSALTELQVLLLNDNQLSGAIPDMSSLSSLLFLWLHNNQLSGPIPATLGNLNSLAYLSLYDNAGLYGYPTSLNTNTDLHLLAPRNGARGCLPSTPGGDDCTIPTKVDVLRLSVDIPTQLGVLWVDRADPPSSSYVVQYDLNNNRWGSDNVEIRSAARHAIITGLTPGQLYRVRVRPDSGDTPWLQVRVTLPTTGGTNTNTDTTTTTTTTTGGTNTGGGGGGSRTPDDRHGDTPATATSLNPRRYTTGVISRTITAYLQSRRDVDYFTLDLPYGGILTAHTTGADTTGRLYQAQEEGEPILVAEDTASGRGTNFSLGEAVEAGTYYLAVSAGRGSGEYRLSVHYTPAAVGNPAPDSFQSGVGLLSGWVCDADTVEIELIPESGPPQTFAPATGTSRADTAVACGPDTTDTGYGLLFNWNLLGDGEHTVRVWMDDIVLAERQITVTTLGPHPDQEFRRDLTATTEVPDFPDVGETTTLRWQTARQNFVIAAGEGGGTGEQLTPAQAQLGIPPPGSFQSGVGVLSGWVCEADTVALVLETATGTTFTEEAGYGTERLDTEAVCGDTDNGFGVLFNWNRLGDGQHTVRAYADGEEFAHSTFNVTTLGEEFPKGLRRTHEIADFPAEGQTTTVAWQEGQQNFVITGVE